MPLPDFNILSIDSAAIAFPEQLQVVQNTDILVGVHDAGLTHEMFLRENGVVVIEIQPSSLSLNVFRNLVKTLGHKYLSTHVGMVRHEAEGSRKRDLVRRDR